MAMVRPAPAVRLVGQLYAPLIRAGESPMGEDEPDPVDCARQFASVLDPVEQEILETVIDVAWTVDGSADARSAPNSTASLSEKLRDTPSSWVRNPNAVLPITPVVANAPRSGPTRRVDYVLAGERLQGTMRSYRRPQKTPQLATFLNAPRGA
jgi:hypothetical protein